MKTISYYNLDGSLVKTEELTPKTVKDCLGMKIRCTLLDKSQKVGFSNPYYSFEKGDMVFDCDLEYITLGTILNLDEETHKLIGDDKFNIVWNREAVPFSIIEHIDAVLYSGLRWGTNFTNKFNWDI